jgi:hypothetical protein
MRADRKSGKRRGCKMNSIIAGTDLGDRESLATVLSPVGDVADRLSTTRNQSQLERKDTFQIRSSTNEK